MTKRVEVRKKMGRPTLYSAELIDEICGLISSGKSITEICDMDGMPARLTLYRWMREYPDFGNAYVRAREERADLLAEEVLTIADTETDPNKARVRVDARKWAAAKLNPKNYGDRMQVDGDLRVSLTDDQLESRLTQLLGKTGAAALARGEGETEGTP